MTFFFFHKLKKSKTGDGKNRIPKLKPNKNGNPFFILKDRKDKYLSKKSIIILNRSALLLGPKI